MIKIIQLFDFPGQEEKISKKVIKNTFIEYTLNVLKNDEGYFLCLKIKRKLKY